jgi:peptidase M28-like protein
MRSRTFAALVIAGVAATSMVAGRFAHISAAGQDRRAPATSPSAPVFLRWPLPASGNAYSTIDGARLWQYVKQHGDIAERYREQGHPQFWGIIAGTSGDADEAQWLLGKYNQIGLTDTHIQNVAFFHPQWAPESWEVEATDEDLVMRLPSAQPAYATTATNGKPLDVPVVYAGLGSDADLAGRDVRGKAVLFFREGAGSSTWPAPVLQRIQSAGAAAIFMGDFRGGNFSTQAYRANSNVPTFNLGTEDALKLRDLIAKLPAGRPPQLRIRLDAKWAADQQSFLVWGTLPGATDETIYVLAHRDGWFDASGDNASGVATMLGLAEYYASVPRNQRRRTMIFIGTDGHHQNSPGGYGREWLAANRERFFSRTALMINAEHPSELLTRGGTAGGTQSIIPLQWYAGGASRPQLTTIAAAAFREFGVPLWDEPSATPPAGDLLPFAGFLPGVVIQSNDFMYMHTSGDSPANVAPTGLEAATRAYARIIDEVNKLPLSDLQRTPQPYKPRIDFASCPAWIKDSSAACTENTERACSVTAPGC